MIKIKSIHLALHHLTFLHAIIICDKVHDYFILLLHLLVKHSFFLFYLYSFCLTKSQLAMAIVLYYVARENETGEENKNMKQNKQIKKYINIK